MKQSADDSSAQKELPGGPRKALRSFAWVIFAAVVAGGAIWGFLEGRAERTMEAEREMPVKAPQRLSRVNDEPLITLDKATQLQSGLRVGTLSIATHQALIRTYGAVLELQQLTDLSNSITTAKAQLRSAEAKLAASKPQFDRFQQLNKKDQIVSTAQLQNAEAAYRVDEAAVASAQSQIQTLTASALQVWGPVLGQAIAENGERATRLIGRKDVLLQITVPPGENLGAAPVNAFADIDNGRRLPITLLSTATKTDPRIQGLSFFYTSPIDQALVPGMNVLALLPSEKKIEGTVVPKSATVWWQGRPWVFIGTGPETFTRREISTAQTTADNNGYVVTGLPQGAQIVIEGAQSLLSEEFRAQVQVGEETPK